MDIQKMLDVMSSATRQARGDYHLTLGRAVEALEGLPQDAIVSTDDERYPSVGPVDSYRGYYSDLAFDPSAGPQTVASVLANLKAAQGSTFEGYKGGDFVMGDDTPLWVAPYGAATGVAVMGVELRDGAVVFKCKTID